MTSSKRQVGGNHYADLAIQPSEFIHRNRLNWCEANAIKYVCRHRSKNGRQDIEKAIHYLELLLEWEYPDAPSAPVLANPAPVPGEPESCGLYRDIPGRVCASCGDD